MFCLYCNKKVGWSKSHRKYNKYCNFDCRARHKYTITYNIDKNHYKFLTAKECYDTYYKKDNNEGKCLYCGKETPFRKNGFKYLKFCCGSCRISFKNKNDWQNEQYRDNMTKKLRAAHHNNLDRKEALRKHIIDFNNKRKNSQYWYEKYSERAYITLKDDKNNFGFVRSKRHKYKNISLRSSWELKLVQFLDKENIKWEYEKYKFKINGKNYLPDFFLNDLNLIIEVRPKYRQKDLNGYKKEFSKLGLKFLIVDETNLFDNSKLKCDIVSNIKE